jgi:hypothetical protein
MKKSGMLARAPNTFFLGQPANVEEMLVADIFFEWNILNKILLNYYPQPQL